MENSQYLAAGARDDSPEYVLFLFKCLDSMEVLGLWRCTGIDELWESSV